MANMAGPPVHYVAVPDELVPHDGMVCHQATGHGMAEDGILDKDIVLVDTRAETADGDVVVVATATGFLIGSLADEDGGMVLVPADPDLKAVRLDPEKHEIEGKVTAILRTY